MKSKIKGANINVTINGNSLPVDADGYVGEIMATCRAQIWVEIAKEKIDNIFAIDVDGKKNVVLKKNFSENPEEKKIYRNIVEIKTNKEIFHTEYPNNHIRLLLITDTGNIQIWEIAIVSQGGHFFVTQQKVWDTFCYNNNDRLSCPLFEGPKGWPQMINILKDLFSRQLMFLPPLSLWKEEDVNLDRVKVTKKKTGVVVWFNNAQGMGVIKTTEGPARVHWSDISRIDSNLSHVLPGETVTYSDLVPPRLTKGRGTSLRFDAIGVSPV